MTIPQRPNMEPGKPKMPINPVSLNPNHDTDGDDTAGNHDTDGYCACGHAKVDHEPFEQHDTSQPAWHCIFCDCTRAYPKPAPASH